MQRAGEGVGFGVAWRYFEQRGCCGRRPWHPWRRPPPSGRHCGTGSPQPAAAARQPPAPRRPERALRPAARCRRTHAPGHRPTPASPSAQRSASSLACRRYAAHGSQVQERAEQEVVDRPGHGREAGLPGLVAVAVSGGGGEAHGSAALRADCIGQHRVQAARWTCVP
jgi:hypothetical protein